MVENKGINKGVKNLIPIKKGERLNPNGRPLGQKNYATLYREALIKLGQLNNIEPDQIELEMIANGLASARKGDFRFYKDVLDRLHGTPVNKTELYGKDGSPLIPDKQSIDKADHAINVFLQSN